MSPETPYLLGDPAPPRFVVRSWDELAPALKAFMFVVPLILGAWIVISVRRGLIVFYVSHLSIHNKGEADPFSSSWCLSNRTLAAVRLGFGFWCLYVWKWMFDHHTPGSFQAQVGHFSFYTVWNYTILTATALLFGFYTLRKVLVPSFAYTARGDAVRALLWSVYQQQLPAALLVSFVFWAVVYPNQPAADRRGLFHMASSNMHFWNSVYMLFELAVNEIPVHLPHAVFLLTLSTVYLFFGVLVKGFVPSIAFLDLAKNSTAGVFAGILVFHFVLYYAVFKINNKKLQWLAKRRGLPHVDPTCVCVHETHVHVSEESRRAALNAPLLENAQA